MNTLDLDTTEDTNPQAATASAQTDTNQQSSDDGLLEPDAETKERIRHLGLVGTAIMQQTGSETSYDTDYFLAKEALSKFLDGIHRLRLDPPSKKGMEDLVAYLQKKVDKRMKHANDQNDRPLT